MVHDCMDRTIMDRAACFVFVSCTIRPRAQRGRAAGFRPRYRYAGYPTSEVDYFVALVTKRAHGLPNTEMTKPCEVSVRSVTKLRRTFSRTFSVRHSSVTLNLRLGPFSELFSN